MSIKLGSFNVENLFRRARILNLQNEAQSADLLGKVAGLQRLLDRRTYDDATRSDIFAVSAQLLPYIDIRVDLGSLGNWKKGDGTTGFQVFKSCGGRSTWTGQITFKDEAFSDRQRLNTGRVIKEVGADVLCAIEVEGMDALRNFNSQVLGGSYQEYLLIDSPNDPRGIDVACLSKYPILSLRTHVFDKGADGRHTFSRDCLELALDVGNGQTLFVLCNHFKSQRGRSKEEQDQSALKRKAQATRVAQILAGYDLKRDWVVVMGDLNEDSSNSYKSLEPMFSAPDLHPIVDPAAPVTERYTHYYGGNKRGERLSQLDYIFASSALNSRFKAYGFERRGVFQLGIEAEKEGAQQVTVFDTVTGSDVNASDHCALWAEFDI
ncbi:MAG: endonuclease/exonuclease/phosphatase family protein [Betaproteobacteria bacterium]|nr:endonuclease/exonuclease/phosphatase family protein [Betaproteobacteria bacterium]